MKFVKKLLACALAGAMSLSMLTACGGSSGGKTSAYESSKLYKISDTSKTGGTIYIEAESYQSDGSTQYLVEAQKENAFYISTSGAGGSIRMYSDGEKVYTVNDANKTVSVVSTDVLKQSSQSALDIPDESAIESFNAEYEEFKGTEYWCETIVINTNGMTATEKFYFTGDVLKYTVYTYTYNGTEGEVVTKINKYLNYIPEGVEIVYSLPEGYTEITM